MLRAESDEEAREWVDMLKRMLAPLPKAEPGGLPSVPEEVRPHAGPARAARQPRQEEGSAFLDPSADGSNNFGPSAKSS